MKKIHKKLISLLLAGTMLSGNGYLVSAAAPQSPDPSVIQSNEQKTFSYEIKDAFLNYPVSSEEGATVVLAIDAPKPTDITILVAAYNADGKQLDIGTATMTAENIKRKNEHYTKYPVLSPIINFEYATYKDIDHITAFLIPADAAVQPIAQSMSVEKETNYSFTRVGDDNYAAYVLGPNVKGFIENNVPRAAAAIADRLPLTFGYLRNANLGIGYSEADPDVSQGGAAAHIWCEHGTEYEIPFFSFGLMVNRNGFPLETENGEPTGPAIDQLKKPEGEIALVNTLAHEMMHAMMYEAVTQSMIRGDPCPNWYIEGLAVTIGGGMNHLSSFDLSTPEKATESMNRFKLNDSDASTNQIDAVYGTGYLAFMYLGYLIADGDPDLPIDPATAPETIAQGLDLLLSTIQKGNSFDSSIRTLTQGKKHSYAGTDDFKEKLATDAAQFAANLKQAAGDGVGSILADHLTDKQAFQPSDEPWSGSSPFVLNPYHRLVTNLYPDIKVFNKGGGYRESGTDINGNAPSAQAPQEDQQDAGAA